MRLTALPAFQDNYIWALQAADAHTVFVDPGQAQPVLDAAAQGMQPAAILLTHHHDDHIGGVAELRRHWPQLPVFAPEDERIGLACEQVGEGDRVELPGFDLAVLAVPGHTRSHIAFHGHGHLFCGDALFSLGCGRMFEGTPDQFWASLERLAALPPDTTAYCAHEYSEANARFALSVDPSRAVAERAEVIFAQRAQGLATVPTTIGLEQATNPFLRAPLLRQDLDPAQAFAALRAAKDNFVG